MEYTAEQKEAVLKRAKELGNVKKAAEEAGVSWQLVSMWRKEADPSAMKAAQAEKKRAEASKKGKKSSKKCWKVCCKDNIKEHHKIFRRDCFKVQTGIKSCKGIR